MAELEAVAVSSAPKAAAASISALEDTREAAEEAVECWSSLPLSYSPSLGSSLSDSEVASDIVSSSAVGVLEVFAFFVFFAFLLTSRFRRDRGTGSRACGIPVGTTNVHVRSC